jgi:hypothetical protein
MELAHRRRTDLGEHGETDVEVVETLRREGYTHLMLCPPAPGSDVEFDPTLGEMLAPWLASHHPLFLEDLTEPDGLVRRYTIYELAAEPDSTSAVGAEGVKR